MRRTFGYGVATCLRTFCAGIVTVLLLSHINSVAQINGDDTLLHRYLQDPLWESRDAYDAAHFLMVPLHHAFRNNNPQEIADFTAFFDRFADRKNPDDFEKMVTLTQAQFTLLITEFLILSREKHVSLRSETYLMAFSRLFFTKAWLGHGWSWEACDTGIISKKQAEFISWKLSKTKTSPTYCRAIHDEELFSMVIARNLKTLGVIDTDVNTAIGLFRQIFLQEIVWNQDHLAWLYQPNVWKDHPDYLWTGQNEKKPNLEKKSSDLVVDDSSHFTRFPFELQVFLRDSEDQSDKNFYSSVLKGLSNQFHNSVLVLPNDEFSGYRMKNFMDGGNGLYRYAAANLGFGPYELSGTLLLSWWIFLEDEKTQTVYCHLSRQFPLTESQIRVYLGPDTTRDRHPLIKGRAQFTSGILESIVNAACNLKF